MKWLKETVYSTTSELLGQLKRNTPDWCNEYGDQIYDLLEEKHKLFIYHLKENSDRSAVAFKEVKAKLQQKIRTMKDQLRYRKAEEMQEMTDRNDSHGLFSALMTTCRPRSNAVARTKVQITI